MSRTTHLQGIGKQISIPAGDLKPGMTLIWNYGVTEEVVNVTLSKSGKTLVVGISYKDFRGNIVQSSRRLNSDRLVVVR